MTTLHDDSPGGWLHSHDFDAGNPAGERGTRLVMWLTLATMAVEIAAGWWFNSMALLADGWHMSSHALALGLAAGAYALARREARDPRYAFGTWKIEVLAGFASAVLLLVVAALMVAGSVERLIDPQAIHYPEAMAVAVLGLLVNLGSAWLLGGGHGHGHDHHHAHDHDHDHDHPHDLNLRSAQVHVLTDAATSVLAIVALGAGWWLGWAWLDPVMGIVGAVLVALWAKGLVTDTARVLLDREMDHPVVAEIREVVEVDGARITDLHVWRVGRERFACAITLSAPPGLSAAEVHRRLAVHEEIVHATIELQ
ncbi:CDF family Co(II)/Ni(II) efflux transporter DmeF [Ideonella sp. 4Y11]|uniref:CDF family Co(II)/Ni(II) efflux transporter DmeF n=1 Tax=Ideonella aquatica TaxID=2824119 RepID=A0A940YN15_9BURK|nr:CDF family Co(II)/Ni(II) efflux transporter DmeF [Ideonella aquatica]MBQ0959356.1 CDF family Co(II)/Ni(II) efflux transporter DmeF [Ideonella aquatica]